MATLSQWIEGARPRTLPAAVSPILVGTGAAYQTGHVVWAYAVLALVVALALQVGVNFANDYSDGIRGTDEVRVGPVRLVGQRLAAPRSVKIAAFACFFFAALMGLALVGPLGAVGHDPDRRGRHRRGVVLHRRARGPTAISGSARSSSSSSSGSSRPSARMATMTPPTAAGWWGAIGVGALASAILVANNLRDIPTDREHGKRTLAVRMGESGTRAFYVALVAVAFVMTGLAALTSPWALLAVLAAPLVVRPMQAVVGRATGAGLIPALAGTGQFQLAWSLLLAVGLALGRA